jgi:hypothetical protein
MFIGFVVDKEEMLQVFLLVPQFPNISDRLTSATYLFIGQMYNGAINGRSSTETSLS